MNATIMSKFGQSGAAFSFALIELAAKNPDIVVLSSDMSTPAGLDKYKKIYPDRFFNVGIAEQNLVGIAAGLASEGWIPIIVAQACFITMRSFEQIRQYCGYMKYPIIVVGYGAGFCLQFMGNTHFSTEDMGVLRTIPGMTVISPADAGEAAKALTAAIDYKKPVYIRFTDKMGCPMVYIFEYDYQIGKANLIKEGSNAQIIATGSMVSCAMKAASSLEEQGVSTAVVDMHTVKPLDGEAINKDAKLIVTVEEHNIVNGLGSAVADYLVENGINVPLLKLGVKDCFSQVGDYNFLLEQHGLTPEHITESILNKIETIK
ncbi:MAG: transketolase C-terminal domain-containing protein [Bacteroidales bacterium]|nr:transketolase [Bacteroidales bacterium]